MQSSECSFSNLGLAPQIIETINRLKFTEAYPIQYKSIPIALERKDLIGIAQTGTGKTMAFVIPTVQHLANNEASALILVPTRELAQQVNESASKIAKPFGIKTAVLIGGSPMHKQIKVLATTPRILIATPGRLIDLIEQRKLNLKKVDTLILDEADRMLDMGFQPQIEKILRTTPKKRQTLLFSATMPPSIIKITSSYMKIPVQIEIAPQGTAAEGVSHELFIVKKEMKNKLLSKLLTQYKGSVLLFCRTKSGTARITRSLRNNGHRATEIHSDRTLAQRNEALEGFKRGKFRILVATDIAARGIDVVGIEVVINYNLPDDAENYVHRIGRTGRAGRTGHAISFATPDQRNDVKSIESIINKTLPISKHADVESVPFDKPQTVYSSFRGSSRKRGNLRSRRW